MTEKSEETLAYIESLKDRVDLRARLAAAEAENTRLEAERQWRPIETAPKDGTPIMIACFHGPDLIWSCAAVYAAVSYGYVQCASRSGWMFPFDFPPVARGADRPRPIGDWICASGEIAPTHWLPLPAAPKKESGE